MLHTHIHLQGLMDAKTISKIHFITGDLTEGSENDQKLTTLIGPNWRELTRAEYPAEKGKAAGFNTEENWTLEEQRMSMISEKRGEKSHNSDPFPSTKNTARMSDKSETDSPTTEGDNRIVSEAI